MNQQHLFDYENVIVLTRLLGQFLVTVDEVFEEDSGTADNQEALGNSNNRVDQVLHDRPKAWISVLIHEDVDEVPQTRNHHGDTHDERNKHHNLCERLSKALTEIK